MADKGHAGPADWSWAARVREVVSMPVIVNGDVTSADDVTAALARTGCAAVMIGRAAITHPWIFREARAALAGGGERVASPTDDERRAVYRAIIHANVAARGERAGMAGAKRYVGVLGPLLPELRTPLVRASRVAEAVAYLGPELSSLPAAIVDHHRRVEKLDRRR